MDQKPNISPERSDASVSSSSTSPPASTSRSSRQRVKRGTSLFDGVVIDVKPSRAKRSKDESALRDVIKEEEDISCRRAGLRRTANAPSPQAADSKPNKKPKGELSPVPPPPAPVRNHLPPVTDPYTRPDVEGFNIFDVTSMGPGLSSHHPDFPPPASLLAEERVRREQLGGSNCAIYQGPNTKLRPFDSHRLTPIASLNIGCTTPGQSWIWCGLKGYRVLELGKLVAVFVKDVEDEKGYNWKSFGLHRVVFIGAPQPGEFSRLAEEKQSAVIDAFDAHWRDKKFWGQTSGLAGEHVRGVPEALQLVAEARAKGAEMATKAVAEKHRAREGNSGLDEERSLALTPADKAEVAEAAEAAEAQAIAQLDDGWGFTSPSLEDLGKSLDKEEKSSHKVKKSFNKVAVRAQIRRDLLAGRGQHVEYACFQYIADNEEELKVVRAKRRERRGV